MGVRDHRDVEVYGLAGERVEGDAKNWCEGPGGELSCK